MASGSYAKQKPQKPFETQTRSVIPARATRQLEALDMPARATRQLEALDIEEETETSVFQSRLSRAFQPAHATEGIAPPAKIRKVVDEFMPHPLDRHRSWLNPFVICMIVSAIFVIVLLSAGIAQRSGIPQLVDYTGGQSYSIQVGGNDAKSWQSTKPMAPKTTIPQPTGPYAVMGKPTITADFINQILASYNSPAAGKGQTLYDMGVTYGIDPAFAMAFFMHESSFGTSGEATKTLSLGNLRCIPNFQCVDQNRGGYTQFPTWEAGFQAWYKLIRNYYVAERGLTTVDKIIPVYAPAADNNDEAAYIAALKHTIDTWHAGIIRA